MSVVRTYRNVKDTVAIIEDSGLNNTIYTLMNEKEFKEYNDYLADYEGLQSLDVKVYKISEVKLTGNQDIYFTDKDTPYFFSFDRERNEWELKRCYFDYDQRNGKQRIYYTENFQPGIDFDYIFSIYDDKEN